MVPGATHRRELIWAATVGIVLADSSVVTLALPAILEQFDTTVSGVAWVLTSFNGVLALAVLPAAVLAARRGAARVWAGGAGAFATGSLVCALAPGVGVLIAGRCVQALGGACVIAGAIELLARSRGSHARGAVAWGAAALAGLAVGPAAGGLLTELISWQAIFAVQVPVVLAVVVAARDPEGEAERGAAGRQDAAPEIALALVSAGLTGALFLLVVLLTEGWGYSPLAAAVIVSVMPAATLVARAAGRRLPEGTAVMAAGAIALAGGLAALGLLPHAGPVWTVAPQVLIGAGIALAVPGLTTRALRGADPQGRRAAGTIAARHAGIVLGLVLLTPVFTAQLESEGRAAQRAGTALILDAPLPPRTKIDLASAIGAQLDRSGGRLTGLGPAFRSVTPPATDRAAYARLERDLSDEVDRAATHAFSLVFLLAGALALLAVVPILAGGGTIGIAAAAATGASAVLIGAYVALGGASYEPVAVADPCKPRAPTGAQANDPLQRIALSALDGAACELRVSREDLVLGLADAKSRAEFSREHGIDDAAIERAVRSGLGRAITEEERAGRLSGLEAGLLRQASAALPVSQIIAALQSSTGQSVIGFLTGLLRQ